MAQKIVYLDQNKWIELSKAYYGIESNPDIKRACTIVIKASESGKAIFPLSVAHLEETLKNSSQERRKRLIDFMIKVSDCYTILPYINLMDYEVENAIRKRIGYPIINLRDYAIGKGISTMVGAKPTINGILPPMKDVNHIQNMNIPDTLKSRLIDSIGTENTSKIIEDWVKSPDGFKWILIRSADSGHKTDNNNDLELIEKIRAEDSKIIDNDLRFRVVLTKSIMQILSLTIARIH
ncbi:MAG: hypothetical protein MUP55_03845, partial [Candidatus Aenigmarchaeota archaeon]|nr:hypothetical protein [Candidatus Aenigmarchaeota archaeon]